MKIYLFCFHLLLFVHSHVPVLGARKVGQILQLTDFHVDAEYNAKNGRIASFCHLSNNSTKEKDSSTDMPGPYGSHRCDAPEMLLEYVLSEAQREVPRPDLIIWTGDNTPHLDYNSTDFPIEVTRRATKSIRRFFGPSTGTVVIPTMGNHDFNPANFVPDQPNELYERTFALWADWIGTGQRDNFQRGGYYKFRWSSQTFLVLNTNMYYVYNHQALSQPEDPAGQFAFLERELELAKQNGRKVSIVGHIPPGAFERELLKLMPPQYNERLVRLMAEYAEWTNWLIFGHLHTDTFRIVKDASGNPAQVLHVSPAVSPLITNNPAFRIYEFHRKTLEIEDIKTFYVDLRELNERGPNVPMRQEYSFREAYRMNSMEPEAFADLLERLKSNDSAFQEYICRNSVQSNTTAPSHMERAYQLCAIGFLDHDGYSRCIDEFSKEDKNGTTNGNGRTEAATPSNITFFLYWIFLFLSILGTF